MVFKNGEHILSTSKTMFSIVIQILGAHFDEHVFIVFKSREHIWTNQLVFVLGMGGGEGEGGREEAPIGARRPY